MGRIKFSVYNTPTNNGKEGTPCARLISRGTKQMQEICDTVGECCTINSADMKGAIEALVNYIGRELANGYSIELEGLGHFSPALRSKTEVNEKGETVHSVRVHGINFRCSNRLKEMVKQNRPQQIKRENITKNNLEERKRKLLAYLQDRASINLSDYSKINHCTHYLAKKDMMQFVEEGILQSSGYRTHRVYIKVEKKAEE